MPLITDWLRRQWLRTPVCGCVLIGGKSRRMGRPKHLIKKDGRTWLARTVELLRSVTERVVIAGAGTLPGDVGNAERLPDVADAEGPMAGILAAMRWAPHVSWLVAACDLPFLSADALRWLLAERAPGVWATLPRLPGREGVEPLLAHYDWRARPLLEELCETRHFRPNSLAANPKVRTPSPPLALIGAWNNINTQADLEMQREPRVVKK